MHSHSKSISPGNAPNGPREGKPKPTDATKLDRIAGQTRGEPTKQTARGFLREREPNPRRRGFGLRSGRIETEGIAASLERKQTETGQVVGEEGEQGRWVAAAYVVGVPVQLDAEAVLDHGAVVRARRSGRGRGGRRRGGTRGLTRCGGRAGEQLLFRSRFFFFAVAFFFL